MDDRPFNIVEYFPSIQIEYLAGSTNDWVIEAPISEGWGNPFSGLFTFEERIDMAGWTKEGLTAFFAAQYLQRAYPFQVIGLFQPPPAQGGLELTDTIIITDVPLDPDTWWAQSNAGFPTSTSDYMTVKFAQTSQWVQTQGQPLTMVRSDIMDYGSNEPTASDTLYCYRLIGITKDNPQPNDGAVVPELRYVAAGIATEEPEFVYLNRLRRSFELRQS